MTDSSGSIAVLLDTRSDEPEPYLTKVLDGVGRLTGFRTLQLFKQPAATAWTLADRREEQVQWQEAVGAWSHRSDRECELFYDLHSVSTGPCEDWYKNIWLAFDHPEVEHIIYLPYDIAYTPEGKLGQPPSGALIASLQSFVDEVSKVDESGRKVDLLLGTYHAATSGDADIPKNYLEFFTTLELFRCFPETMKWLGWTGWDNHKPRTGYFVLSKRLYDEFRQGRPFRQVMLPYGGTFQLILCAALVTRAAERKLPGADQKFQIREWGPIMDVDEPLMVPMDYRLGHQRFRTSFVIEDERMYWSRRWPNLPF